MKYFKNENNEVFAYDDEQISAGYSKELVQITKEEILAITNPPKTEEQIQIEKSQEALTLLNSTDWKVIRELERMLLAGTELNLSREALRSEVTV